MAKYLLGIDIGTSACKAAMFDISGNVVATSTRGYKIYYPNTGWAEQDAQDYWIQSAEAINDILVKTGVDTADIMGVGLDGQSWSVIPMDKNGNVLARNPIWTDTRSRDMVTDTLENISEDEIFALCGNPFQSTYATPKIMWMKKYQPDIYRKTDVILGSNGYIAYKLTGELSHDLSQGYGYHFFDLKKLEYNQAMCDKFGIDLEKLPPLFPSHQVIGTVTAEAAAATGLKIGTPVVAGGLDAACGTLGAAVVSSGQTQEQGGQSGGMSICTETPVTHKSLITGCHVVPNRWLLQGGTTGGGASLKWFNEQLGGAELAKSAIVDMNPFEIMSEEAGTINPGSDNLWFLPYMAGERTPIWDPKAKGVWFGLDFSKTRAHMIRSIMEGVAYSLMHNLITAEETGFSPKVLHSVGGSANSDVWMQIKADITGRTIRVPSADSASTHGAALLAGVGTGMYKDFESAVGSTIKFTKEYTPNKQNKAVYEKNYTTYVELYKALRPLMQGIE